MYKYGGKNMDNNTKLKINHVFKNSKAVGEWFNKDIPKKLGTNTRNSWLKELSQYCKWYKEGQRIIVDEIYDNPIDRVDGRKNNRGADQRNRTSDIYSDLMERIIIYHLEDSCGYLVDSIYALAESTFNIVTDEFKTASLNGGKAYMGKLNIEKHGVIDQYTEKTMEVIRYQFESALKRLQKRGIVEYDKTFLVARMGADNDYHPLTDEEEIEILNKYIKQVEEETEINRFQRKNKNINKKFKAQVIKLLDNEKSESFHNVFGYYRGYTINLINNHPYEYIDIDLVTHQFTQKLIENIHVKVMNKKIEISSESLWGKPKVEVFYPYQFPHNIEAMRKMDKLFFNYKCEDDTNDLFLIANWTAIDESNIPF